MKRILISCVALAAFAAPAVAADGATYDLKAGDYTGTNVVDPLLGGNPVAYYSSDATGNGGAIGGNGSTWNGTHVDQTTTPGSRATLVQDAFGLGGHGRNNK